MIRLFLIIFLIALIIYFIYEILSPPNIRKAKQSIIRAQGEFLILILSLSIAAFILLFLSRLTFGIVLIGIPITLVMIKARQSQLMGQAIRVGVNQFSEINKSVENVASRLSMPQPDVYVVQSPELNAYAMGVFGKKTVVLHSKTIECMNPKELMSILGHEFSHILCGHTKWISLTNSSRFINIPIVSMVFEMIFLFWSRKAEYTADRGGLIACADLHASTSALIKLSVGEELFKQFDINELLAQKAELDSDWFATLSENISTHPYIVKRIFALKTFCGTESYADIIRFINRNESRKDCTD